jgi:hypothetical protein
VHLGVVQCPTKPNSAQGISCVLAHIHRLVLQGVGADYCLDLLVADAGARAHIGESLQWSVGWPEKPTHNHHRDIQGGTSGGQRMSSSGLLLGCACGSTRCVEGGPRGVVVGILSCGMSMVSKEAVSGVGCGVRGVAQGMEGSE